MLGPIGYYTTIRVVDALLARLRRRLSIPCRLLNRLDCGCVEGCRSHSLARHRVPVGVGDRGRGSVLRSGESLQAMVSFQLFLLSFKEASRLHSLCRCLWRPSPCIGHASGVLEAPFVRAMLSGLAPLHRPAVRSHSRLDQDRMGARRGEPLRGRCFLDGAQGCFGFPACSSPAGRTSGRLGRIRTSAGSTSGSNFRESHSASSRIIAQATTASFRASAIPAFFLRVACPPWIRA
jgi:hypothetical protein